MDIVTFVIGVLASLAAGIILLLGSSLISRTSRALLFTIAARLARADVEAVFRNKAEASTDIERELLRAQAISILTGRGSELQRGVFARVLGGVTVGRVKSFRIILPLVVSESTRECPNWLALREEELAKFDAAFGDGLLGIQVRATARYLRAPIAKGRAVVRFFNFPQVGRILFTESVAYFNRYSGEAHGRDCEVVKVRRGGPMYESLERIFELTWMQAVTEEEISQASD